MFFREHDFSVIPTSMLLCQTVAAQCWTSFGFVKISAEALQISACAKQCAYNLSETPVQLQFDKYMFS